MGITRLETSAAGSMPDHAGSGALGKDIESPAISERCSRMPRAITRAPFYRGQRLPSRSDRAVRAVVHHL